ncbi:CRISPR system precrRNA processing endoribonuclease RAMP protein Cas6 [Woodsholea maritima]|uniref:CRISPR system precrRNA processing endoribonuclease RAMP protein Cas6 n=1 Tax=Woodsholea maritima TaxID=240237 RepID=UPI000362686F|nr:CRISPR system precrRNA processing endoribonuclease RAMP protein Cas6 [Woodsholea maritima]
MPLGELASVWRYCDIRITVERPAGFDTGPGLGGRIRGALGARLQEAGVDCLRSRAAFELLFGDYAPPPVRPFNLHVASNFKHIHILVRLHGCVVGLSQVVRDALHGAFNLGIADSQNRGRRRYLPILEHTLDQRECIEVPDLSEAGWMWLVFRGPVTLLNERAGVLSGEGLARSLWARISSLALWQDVQLIGDDGALCERAAKLRWEDRYIRQTYWVRYSSKQAHLPIEMHGFQGSLGVAGALGELASLLAFGAIVQAGARTAFGFGAYDWFWSH